MLFGDAKYRRGNRNNVKCIYALCVFLAHFTPLSLMQRIKQHITSTLHQPAPANEFLVCMLSLAHQPIQLLYQD